MGKACCTNGVEEKFIYDIVRKPEGKNHWEENT
jgi:hypothetical protein